MNSGVTTWITDVWGTSASDVFVVGAEGVILHYDGGTWIAMNSGFANWLKGVGGTSSSDVFAVGAGTILHFDGSNWSAMASGGPSRYHVWGSSPSNIFVVGDDGAVHYDGSRWTGMNTGAGGKTSGIWGASSSDIFAVGDAGAVLHYPEPVPSVVNAVTPGSGELGKTLEVIIKGGNLKGATALMFGPGVAVNSFTIDEPSQITASITIASGAAVGARDVYVYTGNGVGRLYSGFVVNQATPSPSAPENAGTSRLLALWILLGILGAVVLRWLAVFILRRRKRGLKPIKVGQEEREEDKPQLKAAAVVAPEPVIAEKPAKSEKDVWVREIPQLKVEAVQPPKPAIAEKPTAEAATLESVSALKARLASRGSNQGPGAAAEETGPSGDENETGKKAVPKDGQGG
jgi:hypothetical protein